MKSTLLVIFLSIGALLGTTIEALSQGCVAVRSFSGCSAGTGGGAILKPGESLVGANFRYFQSFRHFRGDHEEVERVQNNTEVINDSYFIDLSMTYSFAERFYANVTLPFVYHERSSMYEHGGNPNPSRNWAGERHHTYSRGIADMRLGVGYWLFSDEKHPKNNIAVGMGIKLPTGNYRAKDTFYNVGPDGGPEERYVDQSIQPGDGGLGVTFELQGYRQLGNSFVLNGNFFYLLNPRETNGVSRSNNSTSYMSVPDQYAARIGLSYISPVHGLDFYFGGRMEAIPAHDLVGGSEGFRRPGYIISAEPGASYVFKNLLLNVSVPIALIRNRVQSVADIRRTKETGTKVNGDAAFADYLINVGISFRFGGTHSGEMSPH